MQSATRLSLGLAGLVSGVCLTLSFITACGQGFGGGTRAQPADEHSRFASQFKAGDTNIPWLAMDWFSDRGVYFCRVSQSGNVHSARDVGYAVQGGSGISSRFSLDSTNRPMLAAAIGALPPSATKVLSKERQILVSGICSNQWFARIYDRANVPPEVERLYELTGAYLAWHIPKVEGRAVGRLRGENFSGRMVALASGADLAVSIGQWVTNGAYYHPPLLELWRCENGLRPASPAFKGIPQVPTAWEAVVVSPDGSTIAVAIASGLYVVDAKTGTLRWRADPLDHDSYLGAALAIGDQGKTLYTAGERLVERRDLLTGRKLGSLATNFLLIAKFLKVSHDGSTLVAGFGNVNASATAFALWESGQNEPALRFSDPNGASVGISPDGRTLVLCPWSEKKLVIWDWRNGRKSQVPLRVPYAAGFVHSMHWSPDGRRLAAYVDTYPESIVVYETTHWRPLAQWICGQIMAHSEFVVKQDGVLLQMMGGQINSLDLTALRSVAE